MAPNPVTGADPLAEPRTRIVDAPDLGLEIASIAATRIAKGVVVATRNAVEVAIAAEVEAEIGIAAATAKKNDHIADLDQDHEIDVEVVDVPHLGLVLAVEAEVGLAVNHQPRRNHRLKSP